MGVLDPYMMAASGQRRGLRDRRGWRRDKLRRRVERRIERRERRYWLRIALGVSMRTKYDDRLGPSLFARAVARAHVMCAVFQGNDGYAPFELDDDLWALREGVDDATGRLVDAHLRELARQAALAWRDILRFHLRRAADESLRCLRELLERARRRRDLARAGPPVLAPPARGSMCPNGPPISN